MNFVTRLKIKNAKLTVGEPFDVPEWEGCVNFRKWSGKERALMLTKISDVYGANNLSEIALENSPESVKSENYPNMFKLMAEVVAMSICDENGANMYDYQSPEDVDELQGADGDVLQRLFEEATKRNGLVETRIKEEIKNLEAIQS